MRICTPKIGRTNVADMRDLRRIPGVGASLAQELADLGIRRVTDLRRRSPERLYQRLCTLRGEHIDRCVLYAFRCAVYFASEPRPVPERLKWWNWKDSKTVRPDKIAGASAGRRIQFRIRG
jgi:Pathogenicity locus